MDVEGVNIIDETRLWNWNWTFVCPNGLTPRLPGSNDLAPCFQQICLQLPILILIAISSSYNFGRQAFLVVRSKTQIRTLYLRVFVVFVLAFLPLGRLYFMLTHNWKIWPANLLLTCTECVTWIVHLGYILSLRSHGGVSHRGPLFLLVLWISSAGLSIIWLRTTANISSAYWVLSGIPVLLHVFYGLSLIPRGKATIINRINTVEDERQALLGNSYVRFHSDVEEFSLGSANDDASYLSQFIFYWVNPLIDKGLTGGLKTIDDLFDLPHSLTITRITERLQNAIDDTQNLFRALHRSFGKEFYLIGILRLIADMSGFAGPLLLGLLLKERSPEAVDTDNTPYFYALGLLGASVIAAFCNTHFNWRMSLVSMKMRMGMVTLIYRKSLEARGLQDATPDILNLMSTDTDRIVNSCASFHSFWSIPFQLFTTMYLLYTQVGPAFVAGLLFAASLIPINRWIAIKIGKLSQSLMTAKDARVSVTSESVGGAKQIKIHGWEDIFIKKIEDLREHEIKYLSRRKYLDALCVYFWATTPVLISLLTFGVSVLMGNRLTAATTYTSVALLNMLIGPLNAFPWVLNGLTEAWVSLKRVQQLINLDNLDYATYYSPVLNHYSDNNTERTVLLLNNASFQFEKERRKDENIDVEDVVDFKLEKVNIDIKKKELVCIKGTVGAGKSSLLSAILGNMICKSGKICVQNLDSGFGYVSQNIWLQRGTIRENIIWGTLYDENRYNSIISSCALKQDLEILGGDLTAVGEGGKTLSGGQRVRIALARSIYQNKQIYIFDDILAALDAHVANHIVKHCLLGVLKNQTRIIITENLTLLQNANQILHVEDGIVSNVEFSSCGSEFSDNDNMSTSSSRPEMVNVNLNEDDNKSVDSMVLEETKESGTLSTSVFLSYWRSMTTPLAIGVISSVILMQVSRNLCDAWLAYWVSDTNSNINFTLSDVSQTLTYYLGIYFGLAIFNSIITLVRAFLFAYAGIKAAKIVHKKLLNSVFYTKFKFFDVTPLGRILNRFSSDTYTIDDSLPFILNILLAQLFGLLGALIVSLYSMPWLGLLVVPMCPIYLNLQSKYRHASRDIKRLSSNALSPIYTHFTETLQGLSTIRAMRAANRFRVDFILKLEGSIRAQLTSAAAQQWLGLRLQMLGSLLIGGAGLLAAVTSAHTTNPSLVGLAISYALSITGLLGGVLNALSETEQEMVAIERVNQYTCLEKERNASGSLDAPFGWPCQGVVSFSDVTMRYREHLPTALKKISFETASCERLGIVGRTGAGKSSILTAILRIAPLLSGKVTIDCVDISTLPLNVLRNRIAVVPQDPFLFSGTIRENLDPRKLHSDAEIWNALKNCLASPIIQSLGGINAKLDSGGSNLSAGQKQLLCLARALLKNSKIVCIDEGTANLDIESEHAIQAVLRGVFRSSTVLLIAHRLNSLQHADRIMVMDNGSLVEQGTPNDLSSDASSLFYRFLEEQKNKSFYMNS